MSQTFSGSFSTLHRLAFTDHNAISDKVYSLMPCITSPRWRMHINMRRMMGWEIWKDRMRQQNKVIHAN